MSVNFSRHGDIFERTRKLIMNRVRRTVWINTGEIIYIAFVENDV